MSYEDIMSLNDLDVATPLDGASPQELLQAVRQLKAIVKNVLLVSMSPQGQLRTLSKAIVEADSVGTSALKLHAVTNAKLANDSVDARVLAANAVTTEAILNGAITYDKLGANALKTQHFTPNSIPLTALAGYITRQYISASESVDDLRAITQWAIANGAVTNRAIADVAVGKLTGGDNNNLLYNIGGTWTPVAVAGDLTYDSEIEQFVVASGIKAAVVGDTKSRGTGGGAGTAGAWNIRTLGEITDSDNLLTFSSNKFSLVKGKYLVYITCPASGVGLHQARLFDYSGTAPVIWGSSENSVAAGSGSKSIICGLLDVTDSAKEFQVEHYIQNSVGASDLGAAANSNNTTVYGSHREVYTYGFIARI